ncbi:MAG: hypothetical protein CSA26_08065 [Desulfobacterales bacterium]|nr:MAG: hypothetical protein CSA26_08065 [Desulfobacterales bacterium]
MGSAVTYTEKQRPCLIGYVENDLLLPDNNMTEKSICPFVSGRKSWFFIGTVEGVQASALLYSLIEPARANNIEPYSYVRHIFERMPLVTTLEGYETLLPWQGKIETGMGC